MAASLPLLMSLFCCIACASASASSSLAANLAGTPGSSTRRPARDHFPKDRSLAASAGTPEEDPGTSSLRGPGSRAAAHAMDRRPRTHAHALSLPTPLPLSLVRGEDTIASHSAETGSRDADAADHSRARTAHKRKRWRQLVVGQSGAANVFVQRRGRQLSLQGRTFYANGLNTYWLMYMASIPNQRYLVPVVLKQAQRMGLTVCRSWDFYDGSGWHSLQTSPGVFDENTFQALDYVIATAHTSGIRVHLTLTGNWNDYGGKSQYVRWSRQAGSNLPGDDSAFFVDPICKKYYKAFVKAVLLRKNTLTGLLYRDDPFIFGWDLINEPRVYSDASGNVLQAWIEEMAAYVKTLDPNHLLSVGSEGFYGPSSPSRQYLNAEGWMSGVGTDFIRNNQAANIDIASIHVYANSRYSAPTWEGRLQYYQDYVQGHVDDCDKVLNMPLLIGEFGPDNSWNPFGSIDKRDQVFKTTYGIMQRSKLAGGSGAVTLFWQLMVDELKSWDDGFGVYINTQASTAAIIQDQSRKLAS